MRAKRLLPSQLSGGGCPQIYSLSYASCASSHLDHSNCDTFGLFSARIGGAGRFRRGQNCAQTVRAEDKAHLTMIFAYAIIDVNDSFTLSRYMDARGMPASRAHHAERSHYHEDGLFV